MQLPPLTPYLPDARAIAAEIVASRHGKPDGPDHPLEAGFDVEFAMNFVNRAFDRAGHKMTAPSGFLRVLNSGVFEVLVKGREIELRFFQMSCGPGRGWWFETSEGSIPRGDVWLRLRAPPAAPVPASADESPAPIEPDLSPCERVVLAYLRKNKMTGEDVSAPSLLGLIFYEDGEERVAYEKRALEIALKKLRRKGFIKPK